MATSSSPPELSEGLQRMIEDVENVSADKMASSSSPPELPQTNDNMELNKDLERMIEDVEKMSVQFTWMAYDMVVLRTNPDLAISMQKLKDAYQRCRATVFGEQQPESTIYYENPCVFQM